MPIILRKVHTKCDLNRTQDKRVIYITLWLPWYVTDAYCPKQFVKGKGFFVCDVRVAANTQNCPKNGPLKARLMA